MCERQICAVCKYTRSLGVRREVRRIIWIGMPVNGAVGCAAVPSVRGLGRVTVPPPRPRQASPPCVLLASCHGRAVGQASGWPCA